MKTWVLLAALNLVALFSKAQPEKELVLLTVKDNRLDLAKAIKFLNASDPKLICVNVDLMKCDDVKQFPSNHFSSGDTTAVIRPSESEKKLARELEATRSLLLPSEVRPFGSKEYDEIIGCGFLYPENAATGFVNLINSDKVLNQVEKIQISNTFKKEAPRYHFAVNIAFRLNEIAARSFIKSHPNILPIKFERARKFKTYSMEHFYSNKENGKALKGKVIILSVDRPEEHRLLSNKKRMTTSEIFANIACQLIE
jgi:hypothetical protein